MIFNPTDSNKKGVVMNQTCAYRYEGYVQICCSSIMRSQYN